MREFKINYHFIFGMAVLFTVITTAPAPAVAIGTIDTFDVQATGMVDGMGGVAEQRLEINNFNETAFSWYQSPAGDTSVLGGYRDVYLQGVAGNLQTTVGVNTQRLGDGRTGELSFSSASGVQSKVTVSYDGDDMSSDIDHSGLGGVDLTHAGESNGVLFTMPEVDHPMNLLITIWQNGEGGQKASQYLNEIGVVDNGDPALQKFVAFSDFVIAEGVQAPVMDFSDVGAVAFEYNAPLSPGGSTTAALDFRVDSVQKAGNFIPEPASAVSFLIGSLGLCYFEAFRQRRKRRGMR